MFAVAPLVTLPEGAVATGRRLLLPSLLLLLCACTAAPKRLAYEAMQSPAMAKQMEYAIYLPPDWDPVESLPLVVFLHGGGDRVNCFDKWGIGARLDSAMQGGALPRAVIVVPRGDVGFWSNWADGSRRYEDWVVDDLMPELQARYNTRPCPQGCHLMGISMGGFGALRFALRREGQFASVVALSGPIFDTEQMVNFSNSFWTRLFMPVERIFGPVDDLERVRGEDIYLRWQRPEDLNGLRLFLARATDDRGWIIDSNEAFHRHLLSHNIPHRYEVFEGGHKWRAWAPVIEQALRFSLEPSPAAASQ